MLQSLGRWAARTDSPVALAMVAVENSAITRLRDQSFDGSYRKELGTSKVTCGCGANTKCAGKRTARQAARVSQPFEWVPFKT